jgi:hypothetical protein
MVKDAIEDDGTTAKISGRSLHSMRKIGHCRWTE